MFWVDEIVGDILLKKVEDSYLITDSLTPSGHSHIGSLRGVIIHDLIRRGLVEKGKKTVFQFTFDDSDSMDGRPFYIDESYDKYMGLPLNKVPAPDGKSASFADQYADEFRQVFEGLGIKPVIKKTSELYIQGKFNEAIKIILDNAKVIRTIYKEVGNSDKGEDWFPLQVVCPKCGKVGTTKVTDWNGEIVRFSCEENLVAWAKGCGHEGTTSPFNGNATLPWKVEWPSKWFIFGTDIEGEGKDHFAASGSRDVADAIFRQVFKQTPPYDIRYEHFLVGGAKMSSSKGLGVTAKDMADFLPANILRFLFIRTRFKRAIDFQPEGEAIPLLYDEFDRSWMSFYENSKSDLARAYYYTKLDAEKAANLKYLLRFSKVAYMLQMPRVDILEYAEKEKGSELFDIEKEEIESRIEIAKKWLQKFAPENYKFTVQEKLPEAFKNLSVEQKEFLKKVSDMIKSQDLNGEDLHKEIHNIKNEMKIPPREAFSAIYLLFLGKDSGPQAGWLLASLDKKFVFNRLEESVK